MSNATLFTSTPGVTPMNATGFSAPTTDGPLAMAAMAALAGIPDETHQIRLSIGLSYQIDKSSVPPHLLQLQQQQLLQQQQQQQQKDQQHGNNSNKHLHPNRNQHKPAPVPRSAKREESRVFFVTYAGPPCEGKTPPLVADANNWASTHDVVVNLPMINEVLSRPMDFCIFEVIKVALPPPPRKKDYKKGQEKRDAKEQENERDMPKSTVPKVTLVNTGLETKQQRAKRAQQLVQPDVPLAANGSPDASDPDVGAILSLNAASDRLVATAVAAATADLVAYPHLLGTPPTTETPRGVPASAPHIGPSTPAKAKNTPPSPAAVHKATPPKAKVAPSPLKAASFLAMSQVPRTAPYDKSLSYLESRPTVDPPAVLARPKSEPFLKKAEIEHALENAKKRTIQTTFANAPPPGHSDDGHPEPPAVAAAKTAPPPAAASQPVKAKSHKTTSNAPSSAKGARATQSSTYSDEESDAEGIRRTRQQKSKFDAPPHRSPEVPRKKKQQRSSSKTSNTKKKHPTIHPNQSLVRRRNDDDDDDDDVPKKEYPHPHHFDHPERHTTHNYYGSIHHVRRSRSAMSLASVSQMAHRARTPPQPHHHDHPMSMLYPRKKSRDAGAPVVVAADGDGKSVTAKKSGKSQERKEKKEKATDKKEGNADIYSIMNDRGLFAGLNFSAMQAGAKKPTVRPSLRPVWFENLPVGIETRVLQGEGRTSVADSSDAERSRGRGNKRDNGKFRVKSADRARADDSNTFMDRSGNDISARGRSKSEGRGMNRSSRDDNDEGGLRRRSKSSRSVSRSPGRSRSRSRSGPSIAHRSGEDVDDSAAAERLRTAMMDPDAAHVILATRDEKVKREKKGNMTLETQRVLVGRMSVDMADLVLGKMSVTGMLKDKVEGLTSFQVSISADQALLSEEQEEILNPLSITISAAYGMPSKPVSFAQLDRCCYPTMTLFQFFTYPKYFEACRDEPHGETCTFETRHIILSGLMDRDRLVRDIATDKLRVEVHDRQLRVPDDFAQTVVTRDGVARTVGEMVPRAPYGVATFDLQELIRGSTKLGLVSPILPCRRERRKAVFPPGLWLESGAMLTIRVDLLRPLVRESAGVFLSLNTGPFQRMIVMVPANDVVTLRLIEEEVETMNAAALYVCVEDKKLRRAALMDIHLQPEELGFSELDVVTGFALFDSSVRIFLLEGLHGRGIQRIKDVIAGNPEAAHAILHTSTKRTYKERRWNPLSLGLLHVRMTSDIADMVHLARHYVIENIPRNCFECLMFLSKCVDTNEEFADILIEDFPTLAQMSSMLSTFGEVVAYESISYVESPELLELAELERQAEAAQKAAAATDNKQRKRIDDRNRAFEVWMKKQSHLHKDFLQEYQEKYPYLGKPRARDYQERPVFNYSIQEMSSISEQLAQTRANMKKNKSYLYSTLYDLSLPPVDLYEELRKDPIRGTLPPLQLREGKRQQQRVR
ncbi:hypothetical protein HK101_003310 [Irineochytrium annulatum]|nr:hypothetical protein HK101_003310 [Irineochytrium annulatum]